MLLHEYDEHVTYMILHIQGTCWRLIFSHLRSNQVQQTKKRWNGARNGGFRRAHADA